MHKFLIPLFIIPLLFMSGCPPPPEPGNECKQDYDCGYCVEYILYAQSCDDGTCDPSTKRIQFDCREQIKREFGQSYSGTCAEDSEGAHCIVAPPSDAKACDSDKDCSRCDGKYQYTGSCIVQMHRCEPHEDATDCDSIIQAQFGKPGTCAVVENSALCVVEGTV